MTTIIGIQGDGFCIAASDSRISEIEADSNLISQIVGLRESNGKLGTNGKYILGAAGDLRAINILHHAFNPPTPQPNLKGKKLDHFITAKFIPALRECFEHNGYALPDNDQKQHIAEHSSTVFVAINGQIYIIDGDYSWISDSAGMFAIGTGAQYALGAMYSMMPSKGRISLGHGRKMVLKGLAAAAKFDPYTGAPYHTFVQGKEKEKTK